MHDSGSDSQQRSTVLICDDDPSVRTLARRILANEGYVVLEANDAADALNLAAAYIDAGRPEKVEARHRGHLQIRDNTGHGLRGKDLEGFAAARCLQHIEIGLQRPGRDLAKTLVVVHQQQFHERFSRGR